MNQSRLNSTDLRRPDLSSSELSRRAFLSGLAVCPLLLKGSTADRCEGAENDQSSKTVTDYSRSFCYFVPNVEETWQVRIQMECHAELLDLGNGKSDQYTLGVRTQSGAWSDPPKMPGYDFWMVFSNVRDYVKRVHPTSLLQINSQVEKKSDTYLESGWRQHAVAATKLNTPAEVIDAVRSWRPLVARTVFQPAATDRRYTVEYPIRQAEVDSHRGTYRLQAGPVILLNPEQVAVGRPATFDQLQWAYLEMTDLTQVRCLIERPTSLFESAVGAGTQGNLPDRNPILSREQIKAIRRHLREGWKPPLSQEQMQVLLSTNHYSVAKEKTATTTLFALTASQGSTCRDEQIIGEG